MVAKGTHRAAAWLFCLGVTVAALAAMAGEPPPAEGPPPPEPPPAEAPPAQPPAPEEPPPPKEPPAILPNGGIRLNFKDASLDAVLQYLSGASGLSVVTDAAVEGRITVVSRQDLSVDDSIALLDAALREKGYAAVRLGKVVKIVTLDKAKKANIPVRSGSDPATIAPSDRLITQVIPLRSVDAVKLKDDLKALIAETADLSSNASSNSLILTDTEANIRRIVEIVSALDTSRSTVSEVKVFPLKYADATSAAKLINSVFEVEQPQSRQSQFQSPFSRFFGMGRGGPFGSRDRDREQRSEESEAYQPQKVVAAADQRTNTVVVSGPSDTLKVVEAVVKELDANPQDEEDVLIYRLKNANAANLSKVLTDLFEETDTDATARRTSAAPGAPTTSSSRSTTGRFPFFGQPQVSEATAASASELAGQVRIVADEDTNSLMLMAAPRHFAKLRTILEELDRPVPQVLIKVLIAEVTHDKTKDVGVEFSILNLTNDDEGEGCNLFTDFGVADSTGGLVYRCVRGDVGAAIRLLETVGNLDVLSRPYILTSDNKEATITVGQEVPFIRDTRTTETGQTINTIQYEDIGIILKVTPHINPEGLVIMDVVPEISTLTGTTVPISETVDAEVFAKRSATSRVAIRDGQTIVIGGLMEDRKTDTIRKVPLLGDLPRIGALFRRTIKTTVKTELLIFLTPQVAQEAAALKAISDGEQQRSKLVPTAVSAETFREHMEGMRGGQAPTEDEKPAP